MVGITRSKVIFYSGFSAAVTGIDFFQGVSAKEFVLIGILRILPHGGCSQSNAEFVISMQHLSGFEILNIFDS